MSQIRRLSSAKSRTRVRIEDPPWLAADRDRRGLEAPFHSSCRTFIETAGIGGLDDTIVSLTATSMMRTLFTQLRQI